MEPTLLIRIVSDRDYILTSWSQLIRIVSDMCRDYILTSWRQLIRIVSDRDYIRTSWSQLIRIVSDMCRDYIRTSWSQLIRIVLNRDYILTPDDLTVGSWRLLTERICSAALNSLSTAALLGKRAFYLQKTATTR